MNTVKLETALELMKKKGQWFQRVFSNDGIKRYLKEARAVKYLVKKDDLCFEVNCNETGDLVFSGIKMNPHIWLCQFSTKYWVNEEVA